MGLCLSTQPVADTSKSQSQHVVSSSQSSQLDTPQLDDLQLNGVNGLQRDQKAGSLKIAHFDDFCIDTHRSAGADDSSCQTTFAGSRSGSDSDEEESLADHVNLQLQYSVFVVAGAKPRSYLLTKQLCHTRHSFIFQATALHSKKSVVVKAFRRCQIGKSLENPLEEQKIMSSLPAHPNVISYLDSHIDARFHYSVLELASKGNFADYSTQVLGLPMGDNLARNCFRQLVHGLHHLHSHNVAHLDLSPQNVLIGNDGKLKIADFGCAVTVESDITEETERRVGKLPYMSPEIYYNKPYHPKAADVYALGKMLFAMVVGRHAYGTFGDKYYKILFESGVAELVTAHNASLPNLVLDLLQGMLCAEEKRWTIEQIISHPWVQ